MSDIAAFGGGAPAASRGDARAGSRSGTFALAGVLNLAIVLVAAQACWYVFFSPTGLVRLYTPNVGVALVIAMLMSIHWGKDVFGYWPLSPAFLEQAHPVKRGLVLSVVSLGLGALVMFVFYDNLLGRFGPVFLSGPMLAASGGLGQFALTAQENGCFAQIMLNTCVIFCTMGWLTALGGAPWTDDKRLGRGLGLFSTGLLLAALAFAVFFYPHIAYQFYPAQVFMAAEPWWKETAMTMSSVFHFGWMVPALVLFYWTDLLWEGRPWSLIGSTWLRGAVMAAAVVAAGVVLMHAGNAIMDWYWDTEAFIGGATIENPAWRWNHVAEMAMFMHAAAVILALYFGNGPRFSGVAARALFRTAVAVLGGLALAWLYYELGPVLLGTVPGIGQEGDTSLCWTVMLLILMTCQQVFFRGYPFGRNDD
ncbi:MAG: hypothetical protein H0S85_09465 [Desulfovibrionaceae bacterium]|jgi:AAT family amino acid transporter|nr:hypothetical protein [Desulfovibrionaceae bacterium]